MNRKQLFAAAILIATLAAVSAGCSGGDHSLPMASLDGMPHDVQTAPVVVREAYQFAAANPDIMQQIPCYCGCGDMGHTSNYACYISDVSDDGKITYDSHALGCSICVDITQDTLRLLKQGKAAQEIKAYVDSTYSKYGPSNMP
ncbi:MAG: hypothetical protein FJ030_19585 [Chloroflexi bacterium]|nr:hypothetical protein [Chloroflexota bacterium]